MTSIVSASASASLSVSASATAERTFPGLLQNLDDRRRVRQAWKALVRDLAARKSGPSARDLVVYSLLLGRPLAKAFTPVTNTVKLANGQRPYGSLMQTLGWMDGRSNGMDLLDLLRALQAPREDIPAVKLPGGGLQLPMTRYPLKDEIQAKARAVKEADLVAQWNQSQAA